jgi:hypothetical protein
MMHPAFRGAKETAWGWDQARQRAVPPRRSLPAPAQDADRHAPRQRPDVYTWTFHKPLEAYVKSLRNAGLLIDALEEWPSHKTSRTGPARRRGERGAEGDPHVSGDPRG